MIQSKVSKSEKFGAEKCATKKLDAFLKMTKKHGEAVENGVPLRNRRGLSSCIFCLSALTSVRGSEVIKHYPCIESAKYLVLLDPLPIRSS